MAKGADTASILTDGGLQDSHGYTLPGWQKMAKTVRDVDEEKIEDCKDDIDTLLVFAGLFSAVLTAFVIESYKALQPDTNSEIVFLLRHSLSQNYTMNAGFLNSTAPFPLEQQFDAPTWAVWVNALWFASLICSLSTASIGMLVKQWLREYLAIDWISPQERLRARQYRAPGLARWKVFEISAALPLLLHVSLGLFFAGLCVFTASVDKRIGRSTLPLVSAWVFFIVTSILAPLFTPRCPYKIALLKTIMTFGRRYFIRPIYAILALELWEEEDDVMKYAADHVEILLSVDEVMADDGLFGMMWDVLNQSAPSPQVVVSFVLGIIENRVGLAGDALFPTLRDTWQAADLRALSKIAWDTSMNLVARTVVKHATALRVEFVETTIRLWISAASFPLPPSVHNILADDELLSEILRVVVQSQLRPEEVLSFVILVIKNRLGATAASISYGNIPYSLDLTPLSKGCWDALMGAVVQILHVHAEHLDVKCNWGGHLDVLWGRDAIRILLSETTHAFPEAVHTMLMSHKALLTRILESIRRTTLHPQEVITFVGILLNLRHGSGTKTSDGAPATTAIFKADSLKSSEWKALSGIIGDTIVRGSSTWYGSGRPEWAADAALMLLLARSPERWLISWDGVDGLKVFLAHPSAKDKDHGMERNAGCLLAKRIMSSPDAAFMPLAKQLLSALLEAPSGLANVLTMYLALLRQLPILRNERSWVLCKVLRHHPELFQDARAQPILEDLWDTLHQFAVTYYVAKPDAISATELAIAVKNILVFGTWDPTKRPAVLKLLMYGAKSLSSSARRLCISMFCSIHAEARLLEMNDLKSQALVFDALSFRRNDNEIHDLHNILQEWLEHATPPEMAVRKPATPHLFIPDVRMPMFADETPFEDEGDIVNVAEYRSMDPVRLCWVFLRLYDTVRQRHSASDSPNASASVSTGRSSNDLDQLRQWRSLWFRLAQYMQTYQLTFFIRRGPKRHRRSGMDSGREDATSQGILHKDHALAEQCLSYMELLELTIEPHAEAPSLFPDELVTAIAVLESDNAPAKVLSRFKRRVQDLRDDQSDSADAMKKVDLWGELQAMARARAYYSPSPLPAAFDRYDSSRYPDTRSADAPCVDQAEDHHEPFLRRKEGPTGWDRPKAVRWEDWTVQKPEPSGPNDWETAGNVASGADGSPDDVESFRSSVAVKSLAERRQRSLDSERMALGNLADQVDEYDFVVVDVIS